jgi:hypothetical protein
MKVLRQIVVIASLTVTCASVSIFPSHVIAESDTLGQDLSKDQNLKSDRSFTIKNSSPFEEEGEIIFYEKTNFRGDKVKFSGFGDYSDLSEKRRGVLSDWNDRISSIQLRGRAELEVYRDKNFKGPSQIITRSIPDLGTVFRANWNNMISSFKFNTIDSESVKPQVIFYENPYYSGNSFIMYAGTVEKKLRDKRLGDKLNSLVRRKTWNDKIESIKIIGNLTVIVYEDESFEGESHILTQDVPNLDTLQYKFRNKISSIKVRY